MEAPRVVVTLCTSENEFANCGPGACGLWQCHCLQPAVCTDAGWFDRLSVKEMLGEHQKGAVPQNGCGVSFVARDPPLVGVEGWTSRKPAMLVVLGASPEARQAKQWDLQEMVSPTDEES